MSVASELNDLLTMLSRTSLQQRVLRALVVLATVGFLFLVPAAGDTLGPLVVVVVLLLGLLAAALPDSGTPLGLVLLLVLLWVLRTPGHLDGWLLLAALDLLALHVAATLASYAPPSVLLDRQVLWLWAVRTAVMVTATVLTLVAAELLAGLRLHGGAGVFVAAMLVVLGWLGFVTGRVVRGAPPL